MGLSVTTSTLHVLHNLFQQARWLKRQNKMSIGGKKLRFILSNYSIKEVGIKLDLNYSVKSLTFLCDVSCIPHTYVYGMQRKVYNLCMNGASLDRESLDRVSLTSTTLQDVIKHVSCRVLRKS